jgi:hypothetical protein
MQTQTSAASTAQATRRKQEQQTGPQLGTAHRKLEAFLGRWRGQGHLGSAAPLGANLPTATFHSVERLPGGFFVVDRSSMRCGDQCLESTGIYAYDESSGQYRLSLYDNSGFARTYVGEELDEVWTFWGEHERVTFTFSAGGNALTTFWEIKKGESWQPLCHLESHREKTAEGTPLGRLGELVGTWRARGKTIPGDGEAVVEIVATDSYEWLPGGFFLVHRVDGYLGLDKVDALEIIGPYDPERGSYAMRAFDHQGQIVDMEARAGQDGVWTFTGQDMRAMLTLDADGRRASAFWERKQDGQWRPWMDMTFTR